MKKYTFFSLIISFIVLFYSCSKDDTPPRIFFEGDTETSQTWVLQEYYTLPTATASDNVDGDITSSIVITNDLTFYNDREVASDGTYTFPTGSKVTDGVEGFVGRDGNYTITYSATDAEGNVGKKSISIAVKNSMLAWTETASGTRISYQTRREKLEGNLDIGGVYKIYSDPNDSYYHPTYDFDEGITTDLRADRNTNYKVKITKLANVSGLSVDFVFNRFSNEISIPTQMVTGEENTDLSSTAKTEFMYIVTENGDCNYGIFQFYITYQVERYALSDNTNYDYEFEGKYWLFDRKATYKETFIKE